MDSSSLYYLHMRFIKEGRQSAQAAIAQGISAELLANKHVLWLVCGGSAIPTEAQIMADIRDRAGNELANLTILVGDDRYGPKGHADSNYKQLQDAGFEPGSATWHDVLEHDLLLEETVQQYSQLFQDAVVEADVIIGVFGIGTDGHTAGVKPKSPAVEDDMATVVGYKWDDFTRLTLTPRELIRTNIAFVLAYGVDKKSVLGRLQAGTEPIDQMPCNLLHEIDSVTVYNDQIGDRA